MNNGCNCKLTRQGKYRNRGAEKDSKVIRLSLFVMMGSKEVNWRYLDHVDRDKSIGASLLGILLSLLLNL